MKQIVSKLPYKLRERWRTVVSDIMEQTQQRPKFNDLVRFVEKQSKIMQDPVFGDNQDVRREAKVRAPTVNLPYGKSASKQIFIFAVSPVATNAVAKANVIENRNQFRNVTPPNESEAFTKPCVNCKREHVMERCEAMSKLRHRES